MKKIILALFAVLLFSLANADTYASGNAVCRTITDANGTVTIDTTDPNCSQTLEYQQNKCQGVSILSNDPWNCIVVAVWNWFWGMIAGVINWLINVIMSVLLYTPDISSAKTDYDKILGVVQSLYSLLVACLGLYWIWGAKSVEGRMNAKLWGERIITIIIIEATGFFIFNMALDLNSYITSSIISNTNAVYDFGSAVGTVPAVVIIYIFLLPFLATTAVVLVVRMLLIYAVLMLFPFTLMLYLIPSTKQWGAFALNATMIVIFIGAVDAVIVFSASGVSHFAGFLMIDAVIKPIVALGMFAVLGAVDIWLFLNTVHLVSHAPGIVNVIQQPVQQWQQNGNQAGGAKVVQYVPSQTYKTEVRKTSSGKNDDGGMYR